MSNHYLCSGMKIIRNSILPFRSFDAINIIGLLFCRKDAKITTEVIRHEKIHTQQMIELFVVGFYLWYFIEWLIRLCMKGNAYRKIGFEREAYDHMDEPDYLYRRRPYAWLTYFKKKRKKSKKKDSGSC